MLVLRQNIRSVHRQLIRREDNMALVYGVNKGALC